MRKRFTVKDDKSSFTATLDARLLEPQPIVHIEPTDLGLRRRYLLPHICKYVAWFIVLLGIVSSCGTLSLYGIAFGKTKTYMWIAACVTSFALGTFVFEPIRISILSLVKAVCLKQGVVVTKRRVKPTLVSNPENPEKMKKLLNRRKYNFRLYNPTPYRKLQTRLEDIKYHLEMKSILSDLLTYGVFFFLGYVNLEKPMTTDLYYNNNAVVETFVNGRYTNTINLTTVDTYDGLIEYLNDTLIPALCTNPFKVNKTDNRRKRRSRKPTARDTIPPPDNLRKRQVLRNYNELARIKGSTVDEFAEMSSTINPDLKLIGKARFRQVRVISDSCIQLRTLRTRNAVCSPELNLFNVETRDFSLNWDLRPPVGLTDKQLAPWKYRSAWETTTLPIVAKLNTYPGGGYIMELARDKRDSRIILDYLDTFQWVDTSTRALFIEFSIYCINTNLFDIVTITAERSATGYFIPSYRVETCALPTGTGAVFNFILTVFFGICMCYYLYREFLRIYRTSFLVYLNRAFAVIDLCMVITVIVRLVFLICVNFYAVQIINIWEASDNNDFISFAYMAFLYYSSSCVGAIFLSLCLFKILRLVSYRLTFYQVQRTLSESYRHFVDLVLQKFILMVAFALFFTVTLVNTSDAFKDFECSLLTLFGRTFTPQRSLEKTIQTSSIFALFFLVLFVGVIYIMFVNMFIAVICLYFHTVREVQKFQRYDLVRFMKHWFTFWRQKDIIRLREDNIVEKNTGGSNILRLRGGGNKASKKCKEKEECDVDRQELLKVYLKDFVTKKENDTTMYMDLSAERMAALKYLMIYNLSDDPKVKAIFMDFALRALFYVLATENTDIVSSSPDSATYFFVLKEPQKEVCDKDTFLNMKKVVEDFGRQKGFIISEDYTNERSTLNEKLTVLHEKLLLLVEKLRSVRKREERKEGSQLAKSKPEGICRSRVLIRAD